MGQNEAEMQTRQTPHPSLICLRATVWPWTKYKGGLGWKGRRSSNNHPKSPKATIHHFMSGVFSCEKGLIYVFLTHTLLLTEYKNFCTAKSTSKYESTSSTDRYRVLMGPKISQNFITSGSIVLKSGWMWLRGKVSVLLSEGRWLDSPALHV